MEQLPTNSNANRNAKRKLTFEDSRLPKNRNTLPNLETVAGSVVVPDNLLFILKCLVDESKSHYVDYILATSKVLSSMEYGLYLISLKQIDSLVYGTNKQ